jgi:hypothetical protein
MCAKHIEVWVEQRQHQGCVLCVVSRVAACSLLAMANGQVVADAIRCACLPVFLPACAPAAANARRIC